MGALPQLIKILEDPLLSVDFIEGLAENFSAQETNLNTRFAYTFQTLSLLTGGIGPPTANSKQNTRSENINTTRWPVELAAFPGVKKALIKFIQDCLIIREINKQINPDVEALNSPIDHQDDLRLVSLSTQAYAKTCSNLLWEIKSLSANTHFKGKMEFSTELGDIGIYGNGNDVISGEKFLVIDFGGDDHYSGTLASSISSEKPFGLLIDLAGNDKYNCDSEGQRLASGVSGCGYLIDMEGNDEYNVSGKGLAYSHLGSSLLWDLSGSDIYRCNDKFGLSSATFGASLLIDQTGDDQYLAGNYSMGFAGTSGAAFLIDYQGNDTYLGQASNDPASFTMGASKGLWGETSNGINRAGGFGVLIDYLGNDEYQAGSFSQGAAYYWGGGFLMDLSGDDKYDSPSFAQGSAAHYASGCFIDKAGEDIYNANTNRDKLTQSIAYARDFSSGIFLDRQGKDRYFFGNNSLGIAEISGAALMIDYKGQNQYNHVKNKLYPNSPSMGNTKGLAGNMNLSHTPIVKSTYALSGIFKDLENSYELREIATGKVPLNCTSFVIKSGEKIVLAKNLDWPIGNAYLVLNQPGVQKTALIAGEQGLKWISKYGSISFNQFGYGFPLGGMNEHGLVLEELSSPEWGETHPGKNMTNEFQWIQYQLDMCKNIEELIACMDSHTLQYQLLPLHYIATDKEGNTAVIEIANGQLKVYNQNTLPYPVLSNNLYPNSLKYLRNYKGFGGQMPVVHRQGSNERFVSVCSIMEKSGEIKNPDKFAMRILDTVKQHDTQLSIIYSPDKMTIRFKTYGQIDEHQVKITPAMFSPAEKPRFINVETISATRIKNSHFKELTKTEHQDLLTSVSKKMEEEEMLNDKTRKFLQMILNMNY